MKLFLNGLIIINHTKEKIHSKYEFINNIDLIDIYDSNSLKYELRERRLSFDLDGEDAMCVIYKNQS